MKRSQFSSVLAKAVQKLRLPMQSYASHSFRIGRASDLASRGYLAIPQSNWADGKAGRYYDTVVFKLSITDIWDNRCFLVSLSKIYLCLNGQLILGSLVGFYGMVKVECIGNSLKYSSSR